MQITWSVEHSSPQARMCMCYDVFERGYENVSRCSHEVDKGDDDALFDSRRASTSSSISRDDERETGLTEDGLNRSIGGRSLGEEESGSTEKTAG